MLNNHKIIENKTTGGSKVSAYPSMSIYSAISKNKITQLDKRQKEWCWQ